MTWIASFLPRPRRSCFRPQLFVLFDALRDYSKSAQLFMMKLSGREGPDSRKNSLNLGVDLDPFSNKKFPQKQNNNYNPVMDIKCKQIHFKTVFMTNKAIKSCYCHHFSHLLFIYLGQHGAFSTVTSHHGRPWIKPCVGLGSSTSMFTPSKQLEWVKSRGGISQQNWGINYKTYYRQIQECPSWF